MKHILITTPVDCSGDPRAAHVTLGYHIAVRALERAGALRLPDEIYFADDLARGRSRAVWYAATQCEEWDYLLHWDDDVIPNAPAALVKRMVETGFDVVGAPYPRKRNPLKFPYVPLGQRTPVVRDCAEVKRLAFGFMLTSRACIDAMLTAYADEWFTDEFDQDFPHETIALFKQLHTEETERDVIVDGVKYKRSPVRYRELLPEDFSFCERWRAIGGKVQMYVGEGAPVGHVGGFVFQGEEKDLSSV